MSSVKNDRPHTPKGAIPRSDGSTKAKPPRVTRQRRERLNEDAFYLVLRDAYLIENPHCAWCFLGRAVQVHHVVGGTAGKSRSLLNQDTWLGACSDECHDLIASQPAAIQIAIKQNAVRDTIERLRK